MCGGDREVGELLDRPFAPERTVPNQLQAGIMHSDFSFILTVTSGDEKDRVSCQDLSLHLLKDGRVNQSVGNKNIECIFAKKEIVKIWGFFGLSRWTDKIRLLVPLLGTKSRRRINIYHTI